MMYKLSVQQRVMVQVVLAVEIMLVLHRVVQPTIPIVPVRNIQTIYHSNGRATGEVLQLEGVQMQQVSVSLQMLIPLLQRRDLVRIAMGSQHYTLSQDQPRTMVLGGAVH